MLDTTDVGIVRPAARLRAIMVTDNLNFMMLE